jgi:hypothetical protein
LVSSIHDSTSPSSTEIIIQKTIEGIQRMISPYSLQGEGEVTTKAVIEISLAAKKH